MAFSLGEGPVTSLTSSTNASKLFGYMAAHTFLITQIQERFVFILRVYVCARAHIPNTEANTRAVHTITQKNHVKTFSDAAGFVRDE